MKRFFTVTNSRVLTIYTDGSKTLNGSGIGIYANNPNINISIPMDTYTTITQAEICAINVACNTLRAEDTANQNINICSDSQASLNIMNGHCFTSKVAIECRNSISLLKTNNNNVNLIWVPGHSDIDGNEKADLLAREGSDKVPIGPGPIIGLTYSTQRSIIRNFFKKQHEQQWRNLTIINAPNYRNTKFILNKSRKDVRLIISSITGHCNLNKHMYRLGLSQSQECSRCNEEDETPLHLLTSCPALTNIRRRTFGQEFISQNGLKGHFGLYEGNNQTHHRLKQTLT